MYKWAEAFLLSWITFSWYLEHIHYSDVAIGKDKIRNNIPLMKVRALTQLKIMVAHGRLDECRLVSMK